MKQEFIIVLQAGGMSTAVGPFPTKADALRWAAQWSIKHETVRVDVFHFTSPEAITAFEAKQPFDRCVMVGNVAVDVSGPVTDKQVRLFVRRAEKALRKKKGSR